MKTKLLFTTLLTISGLNMNSQSVMFQKTYSGETANHVQQTADGGYAIVGETTSGIIGSQNDVLLIKTDSAGNVLWNKTYGGTDNEYGYCVRQTSDGGYIIAGDYSYGSNQDRGFLIKTNSSGDTLWTKIYGAANNSFHCVRQTSDGGYIACGEYLAGGTYDDAFLIKVDNMGNVLWAKRYGYTSNNQESLNEVQQTTDGGYIAVGNSGTSSYYPYVIKVNSAGDTLWSKEYYSPYGTYANSTQQTSDGGYIIAGLDPISSNMNGHRASFIKINSTGNIQWQKIYGSATIPVEAQYVRETSNGEYVALLQQYVSTGNFVSYLLRLNSAGTSLWCESYQDNGDNGNQPIAVQETSGGGFVFARNAYLIKTGSNGLSGCNEAAVLLAVATPSYAISNPAYPINTISGSTGFLPALVSSIASTATTLCLTVGVPQYQNQSGISVFPNPTSGKFTLDSKLTNGEISIYNLFGEKVYESTISNPNTEIDLTYKSNGIYFINVKTETESFTQKIIIQK